MTQEDVKFDEETLLQADLLAVQTRLQSIQADPEAYARDRVAVLTERLAARPERHATKRGHISMYDHIQNLKTEYQACIGAKSITGRVAQDVSKLATLEAEYSQKIEAKQAEVR